MNKKSVIALCLAVLLCVLALLVGMGMNRGAPGADDEALYLLITADGHAWEPIPLEGEGEYTVTREDGSVNVVHMGKDGVWMAASTCKNQDCVRQGEVTRENRSHRLLGNQIICLPNKVIVQLCTRTELDAMLTLD